MCVGLLLKQNRSNVVVMGDLIEDTDVIKSIVNPENVFTVGFLNEKVWYFYISFQYYVDSEVLCQLCFGGFGFYQSNVRHSPTKGWAILLCCDEWFEWMFQRWSSKLRIGRLSLEHHFKIWLTEGQTPERKVAFELLSINLLMLQWPTSWVSHPFPLLSSYIIIIITCFKII